jgi:hypothetical protein
MSSVKDWLAVIGILAVGFVGGWAMMNVRLDDGEVPVAHRQHWEFDPQGQGENLSADACRAAGRTPYYIYPDNVTPFYEECLK